MLSKNKIRNLESRKLAIIRNIKLVQEFKQKIISYSENLAARYKNNEISWEEYTSKSSNILKGRTVEEWIDYYDRCIADYQNQLISCNWQVEKEENKSRRLSQILAISLLLVVFGFGLFLLPPSSLTGLAVYESQAVIDENVSFNINSPMPNSSIVKLILSGQSSSRLIGEFADKNSIIIIDNASWYNLTYLEINARQFNIFAPNASGLFNLTARIIDGDTIIAENITEISVRNKFKVPDAENPVVGNAARRAGEINFTIELGLPPMETTENVSVMAALNNQSSTLPLFEFTITNNIVLIELIKFDLVAEEGILNIKIILNGLTLNETTIPLEMLNNRTPEKPEIKDSPKTPVKFPDKLLFDIKIAVPEEYLEITAGSNLTFKVNIHNFGAVETNITILYRIKDGKDIIAEEDYLSVATQYEYLKTIILPDDIEAGSYFIEAELHYNDETALATSEFFVTSKYHYSKYLKIALIITLVLIALIFLSFKKPSLKEKFRKNRFI